MNSLFYGDNLEVLPREVDNNSVDLIYLDPPFNSNRSYNVLFKSKSGEESQAQIEAFDDTWIWSQQSHELYEGMVRGGAPIQVADALEAMRRLLGDNDVLAYLVMMTARLLELRRVLKPTGALYLHCDPTASHYLKIVLDSIFGAAAFRSEIIWKRYGSHNDARHNFAAVHDVILYYAASPETPFYVQYGEQDLNYIDNSYRHADADGRRWRVQNLASPNPRPNLTYAYTALNGLTYQPHRNGWKYTEDRMRGLDERGRLVYPSKPTGRLALKSYLDETKGSPLSDVWVDVKSLSGAHAERLGYPTQKPLALLERIISVSSQPGDVVLDPFCGCGTTVDAAQRLDRQWIGIDITYLAVDLIDKRLWHTYGDDIRKTYSIYGIPRDLAGAQAMFDANHFEFERWAVTRLDAEPNEKQVGDKGSDGTITFPIGHETGRIILQVKGGKHVNPTMVRDLIGTVSTFRAEMGILITMDSSTRGVRDALNHSGTYKHPITGTSYPRIQAITVAELLAGKRPQMPTPNPPYIKARTRAPDQPTLGF